MCGRKRNEDEGFSESMKIINHIEEDRCPVLLDDEDKWIDNRMEPIVRVGGEPFESHFEPEFGVESFIVDPRRSLVRPVYARVDEYAEGAWQVADFLVQLIQDLGFNTECPDKAKQVAFWTMMPFGVSRHLEKSWLHIACYNARHPEVLRVINNPFYYADSNTSESRLLEIAHDGVCSYAVDLANPCESAETLSQEIALLNHIHEGDAAVAEAYLRIIEQVRMALC